MNEAEKAALRARLDEILNGVKERHASQRILETTKVDARKSLAVRVGIIVAIAGGLACNFLLRDSSNSKDTAGKGDQPVLVSTPTRIDYYERIASASNDELERLVLECRGRIEQEITKTRQPFAVYFPNYNETDLESIHSAASAFRTPMGRPSTIFEGRNVVADNVKHLRERPSLSIQFVVESASDWFSGPKRWAAVYACDTHGLEISGVRRRQRYFMD